MGRWRAATTASHPAAENQTQHHTSDDGPAPRQPALDDSCKLSSHVPGYRSAAPPGNALLRACRSAIRRAALGRESPSIELLPDPQGCNTPTPTASTRAQITSRSRLPNPMMLLRSTIVRAMGLLPTPFRQSSSRIASSHAWPCQKPSLKPIGSAASRSPRRSPWTRLANATYAESSPESSALSCRAWSSGQ